MSMYGYDVSVYDYGFSDQSIAASFYGNSISPMLDYGDEVYVRRRPPAPRANPTTQTQTLTTNHRHDGTSPLPLGMDWSLPPRIWEGRNSVWPHDSHKRWSYCVAIPSWAITPSASGSDTVFFSVKVGIQSPQGITTTRTVQRRFNDFLKLYSELKKEFPKKSLPLTPPRQLMKTRSKKFLEERLDALEKWMQNLLSDVDVSRTADVAIFLELEAAARQACCELNENESAANLSQSPCMSEMENSAEPNHVSNAFEKEDMEELQKKCAELELKLATEQDARLFAESLRTSTIEQNEKLVKELDDAKEQINILRKQQDEVEVKAKSDVKLLVKEIKSLRTSHSDLKQELNKCLEEKAELEKEKQKWESGNSLLHGCKLLHNRLGDCSVKFLIDEEDKPIVDTSLSDAIDLLETSDAQISLLLSEAKLIARDEVNKDDELRMLLGDILVDNVKLRKQVNSVIRYALSKPLKDGDGDEDKLID